MLFTPHLAPMNRGILATCYARPTASGSVSTDDVLAVLRKAYADEPFVVVVDGSPSTKATLGSNAVHVTARADERTGWVLAIAALDNLTKGASGQAVQCANLLSACPRATGSRSWGRTRERHQPDRSPPAGPVTCGAGLPPPGLDAPTAAGILGATRWLRPSCRAFDGLGLRPSRRCPMSVMAAQGFVADGLACGIKASGDLDLALVATADGGPSPPRACSRRTWWSPRP